MWIRKNSVELKNKKNNYKINIFTLWPYFIFFSLLLFFKFKILGYGIKVVNIESLSWNETFKHIPICICFALIFTLLLYHTLNYEKKSNR